MTLKPEIQSFVASVNEALTTELADAIELRRRIHQTPEVSWQEQQTSALVAEALEGYTLERVAETGLLVRVGNADALAVGVRAELDGLPIVELTGSPFASTNGAMRACGHDVHLAALVSLLRAFTQVHKSAAAPIALLGVFQPSEESFPSGAKRIIETGRLEEHHLQAMLAVHLHPQVPWGAITTGVGAVNAGADSFTLTISGVGGHGAYPHRSHDPVLALSQVIVALQQIVSRRTDPMHPTVVSICRLRAGTASNVIPDEAVAEGTVRVLVPGDRDEVLTLLTSIASQTASAFGCTSALEIQHGDPVLVNDARLVTSVDPWLARVGFTVAEPMRSCGADDFAFYGACAPSLMMFLGVQGRNRHMDSASKSIEEKADASDVELSPGLHSPLFFVPDDAVERTARAMLAAFAGAAELVTDEGRDR